MELCFVCYSCYVCSVKYLFAFVLLLSMLANLAFPLLEQFKGDAFCKIELSKTADEADGDTKEETEKTTYTFHALAGLYRSATTFVLRHPRSFFYFNNSISSPFLKTPDLPPEF